MDEEYAPIEIVRARMRQFHEDEAARAAARADQRRAERPTPKRTRKRTKPGALTRERLRQSARERAAAEMLAKGCTPLARARIEAGLTLTQAAHAAGIHPNTWHAAEHGHHAPSRVTRHRIGKALGVNPTELFG